ncbi:Uncharacterised protein [Serratia quinivorans]|uniref:Uncharacterized protein n=1 Tax=Serratia quinivorans TaxID=137545 RepID=A0A380B5D4_9GAMM|nr:Uncharacterised protein [Serratia quinivorans]SUI93471.1 Uncharacterised protein [Serratia quinivorans]
MQPEHRPINNNEQTNFSDLTAFSLAPVTNQKCRITF